MLPSPRMPPSPPSPRSASSSKLSPLYVSLSPVARAERCKPCPVALVPTLLLPASTSQPPSVDIRSVRKYNTGVCLNVEAKTVLIFSDAFSYPARKETPTHTLSLVPPRARVSAAGKRRFTIHCLHPCPRTHGKICGKKSRA